MNPKLGGTVQNRSKFGIRARTLDDALVIDGLKAVSLLTDVEPYCVVGGIATQSYVPSENRRGTSDIDLSIGISMQYSDFHRVFGRVVEYLRDYGYQVEPKKNSRSYALHIQNPEGEREIIEVSRRNEQNFNANEPRLMREIRNAKRKIVDGDKSTYVVASAEDIVLPKMMRIVNSMARNHLFSQRFAHIMFELSDKGLPAFLVAIDSLREDALINVGDPRISEELRFDSDIYDVRCLSVMAGINPQYLRSSLVDWNSLTKPSNERDIVFNGLLPQFHP